MNGTTGMNGTHDGAQQQQQRNSQAYETSQIEQALELVHNPRSTNEQRQAAFQYLEGVKEHDDAPAKGYFLCSRKTNSPIVRHYGLSLLEMAIRHRWQSYQPAETSAVRAWVLELAQGVDESDPMFIRNKVAQLWVEVAKRSWALDWMNMDEMLVELWNGSAVRKVLVLEVLETLSENSFGKEDTTTALRGQDLSKACVEIFAPESILVDHFPGRDTTLNVRYGEEGWLARVSDFLGWCNEQDPENQDVQLCIVKALSTLKSALGWSILLAIASANSVQRICQTLLSRKPLIQLV
jgi:exportin-5